MPLGRRDLYENKKNSLRNVFNHVNFKKGR